MAIQRRIKEMRMQVEARHDMTSRKKMKLWHSPPMGFPMEHVTHSAPDLVLECVVTRVYLLPYSHHLDTHPFAPFYFAESN